MDNTNSLNATEIAVGSLLAGGYGRGGYGGGAWGGGYGGYAPFAGPASNAVRINRNRDFIALGLDRISDQNEENRRLIQNQNTDNRVADGFLNIQQEMFQSELRQTDRLRDITNQMNADAAAAAKCCCDTQRQIGEVELRLSAKMDSIAAAATQRDLDRAERRITQLEIFRECGCGCQGGVQPCPPPQ